MYVDMCNSNWCTLHMASYINEHTRVLQHLLLTFVSPSKNIHRHSCTLHTCHFDPFPFSIHIPTYTHNYTYTTTHTHNAHPGTHAHLHTHNTHTHTHTHTDTHTYQFLEETVSVLAVFQRTHFSYSNPSHQNTTILCHRLNRLL